MLSLRQVFISFFIVNDENNEGNKQNQIIDPSLFTHDGTRKIALPLGLRVCKQNKTNRKKAFWLGILPFFLLSCCSKTQKEQKISRGGIEPPTSAVLKPRHNQLDHLDAALGRYE